MRGADDGNERGAPVPGPEAPVGRSPRDTVVAVAQFAAFLTLWPWAMFSIASLFFGDSPQARVDVLVRLHWWTFLYPFAVGLGIALSIGLRRARRRIRLLALLALPAFILLMITAISIAFFR